MLNWRRLETTCQRLRRWILCIGCYQFCKVFLISKLACFKNGLVITVTPKGTKHPLRIRAKTSDIYVFEQVYVEREYEPLLGLPDVKLVIDCGANVGYSSSVFLSSFAACTVIAVEPDYQNFEELKKNLAAYGSRVKLIQGGVWSRSTALTISESRYRDGMHWARQVRECSADDPTHFFGYSVGDLLAESGMDAISILKMDIEGAEAEVFRNDRCHWLSKTEAIAIELHDDSSFGNATEMFEAVVAEHFRCSRSGELRICHRIN